AEDGIRAFHVTGVQTCALPICGFMAGKLASDQPSAHGALAGVVVFALVQVIGVLGRMDRDATVSIPQILVLGLLAACVASLAAQIGRASRRDGGASAADQHAPK